MLDFFISSAMAEGTTAAAQNPLTSFMPLIIIFFIFYFLIIKPQKKKVQEEQALLGQLTKGDEVFTKAGLLGTITGMTEKIVTLEVAEGVKLKVIRGQIAGLSKTLFEKKDDKKNDKKADKK